jgi:hypothetical protein
MMCTSAASVPVKGQGGKMNIDKHGIYQISNEAYHADPCLSPSLSRGTIKELLYKTPAHVFSKNKRLNPRHVAKKEKEEKFDIGNAAHSLFLEGINNCEIVYAKDWKTADAKRQRDEARLAGKTPLLEHQFDDVRDMVNAAHKQLRDSEIKVDRLDHSLSEQTIIWQDGQTWCRCRPDYLTADHKIIIDYKTSTSADPDKFLKQIVDMGYDIQWSWYRDGVTAVTGIAPKFYFMVQEVEAPYLCSFIGLPPQFQEMGKQKVEYGKAVWNKCLSTGVWPGYPKRVCYVEPAPYQLSQWEERASNIELGEAQ